MSQRQIENRNFLTPTSFRFTLQRAPKTSFLCNQANIPDLNLGVAVQQTYLKEIPRPGEIIDFGDLNLRFLVDEDLTNYVEIQNWIRGLGFPEDTKEFYELTEKGVIDKKLTKSLGFDIYSDGMLQILTNNLIPQFQVNFQGLFPTSLSTLVFDATDTTNEYFTADVTFKYMIYTIENMEGDTLC